MASHKNGDLTPNDITAGKFKPVWWLCPKCGYEWQASPNNRKRGIGCPCCSGRVPKTGVNDLETLYPELLKEWNYERNSSNNLFHHSFFLKVERKHGGNALVADMNGMQLLQAE